MANKPAPYKQTPIIEGIVEWFTPPAPGTSALDLYQSYYRHLGDPVLKTIDPNQFAKCLVVARITTLGGGVWVRLPDWEPKEHEITRARIY